MKGARQVVIGILASVLSAAILFGSFGLALTESNLKVALQPSLTMSALASATPRPSSTLRPSSTAVPPTSTATPTLTLTSTSPTGTATPTTVCNPPADWIAITVEAGQTLESIAQAYNITPQALAQGNCLSSMEVTPGMVLFVPTSQPTPSPTEPCGPPRGWVIYTVQPGDTLYSLAQELNVSVYQLQAANCMIGQTSIRAGQNLYVPRLPVRVTPTFTSEPTDPPEPTSTPAPTDTPEPTPLPTNPNDPPN